MKKKKTEDYTITEVYKGLDLSGLLENFIKIRLRSSELKKILEYLSPRREYIITYEAKDKEIYIIDIKEKESD